MWLKVQAQDNEYGSGVERVVFTGNGSGSWQVIGVDTAAPFEMEWDMAGVPNDYTFMIGAEIYDRAGNRSDRVRWITKVEDKEAPTGDFTAPAANAQVSAPVSLKVQAQDNENGSGLALVQFTTNSSGEWQVIGVDTTAPFEMEWDMADVPGDQRFMIGVQIYDRAGNRTDRVRWISKKTLQNGDFEQVPNVGWGEYSSNGYGLITQSNN